MKYLNLIAAISQDAMLIKSTDTEVGIWFRLICYCHQQMNGGSIQDCKEWTDDMWMRAAGIKAESVSADTQLWHYNAMGWLIIHHYDLASEEAYRRKQRMGKVYIERRWQAERERKIIKIESGNSGKPQKDNHA